MPVVEAHILQGYASADKTRLTHALTQAVRFVVPAPDEAITVMLHEYPSDAYARGGTARLPAVALPDPADVVMRYLRHMEARELDSAQDLLADDFVMMFPGAQPMRTLDQLIEWARPRYRFVKKAYEATEAFQGDGAAVVYARGHLQGEWPDRAPFEGIRFVDRFEVRHGAIIRQDVWNDMGEVRPR